MVLSNSGRSEFRGVMMVQKILVVIFGFGMLASAYGEDNGIVYKPLSFGAFSEFGMLQSGQYGGDPEFKDEWVDHFGAYIAQTISPNEDLAFDIGLGGVFEYQKAEIVSSGWGGTQYKNFFVGPSVADIRYLAAAKDGQGLGLQYGIFPYKYNPDASNLGEYLFRSGAYPNYITSGGLWFLNNTSVQLQALKASYNNDAFTSDYFLVTETSMPALYDISSAVVVGYKLANGLVDLGAGINFKHLIAMKPSHTSPKISDNAYFTKNGVTYTGNTKYYTERASFSKRRAKEDPANAAKYLAQSALDSTSAENVKTWMQNPDSNGISPKYYTERGLIGMLRASVDFKKIFDSESFGPEDMRLYAEAAILGIQNYPFYYTDITRRMPIMVGFNIPTFRFLDLFSVQMEYFNSPDINSYAEQVNTNSAIPTQPSYVDLVNSKYEYNDGTKHDNVAWSILAKKNLGGRAFISGQIARDHIRTVSINIWTAPEPDEVLIRNSDWYWMLQFGYGI